MPKGGGGEGSAKIFGSSLRFLLLHSMKMVFNLGKLLRGKGMSKIFEYFFLTFDHLTYFKSAERKNNVQGPKHF